MTKKDTVPRTKVKELILKGQLTIQRVFELKESLEKALKQVDTLMINLAEVEEIDLACLQMLCSAHRTATNLNKTLSLLEEYPRILETAMDAGFIRHVGCTLECNNSCLWKEQNYS
jgi:ABC-type transporter Mla MlaB component